MKERLVTLGLATCALALFWILLFPKPQSLARMPHPLTSGSDGEGYAAMYRWLSATGIRPVDLHQRFGQLSEASTSGKPTGNLLIITLPFEVAPHPEELTALAEWVGRGNTLLVLAGLDDTPLWSALADDFLPQLQKLTTIKFIARQEPDVNPVSKVKQGLRETLTPAQRAVELKPSGSFPVLEGVRRLAAQSPLPSTQWQAEAMDVSPVLELARRADSADPALWLKSSGRGTLIVSGYASLFNNDQIGKADNARLLSNVVAWSLQPGGRVIIDDAHQGAMNEFDAAKFFADSRLHDTLLWLLLLWLAWVVAAQPLRAAAHNGASLDESAMLRVTAGFFASVLRPVAAAQWLMDEFFDRLRRRHGLLHSAGPPWEWLSARAGVGSTVLDELRDMHASTQAGRRVSLTRLQRILSRISGQTS